MKEFKLGDRVYVLKDTPFCFQALGQTGVVIEKSPHLGPDRKMWIRVRFDLPHKPWASPLIDTYPVEDLILASTIVEPETRTNLNRKILDIMRKVKT
jgi:hypothetical protein